MGWGLPGIKFVTGIGDGRNNEKTMTIVPSIAVPFPYPGSIYQLFYKQTVFHQI